MNREALAFVVHVGDFKAAVAPCSDELFLQRREWFELVAPSVRLRAGRQRMDRLPAHVRRRLRSRWSGCGSCASCSSPARHSLGQRPLALVRQPAASRGAHDYPEHARWEHGGVLFVTLNVPGPDNNARAHAGGVLAARCRRSLDWIARGFRLARSRNAKAVVVVMHANPWSRAGAAAARLPRAARRAGRGDPRFRRARCCSCTATRTATASTSRCATTRTGAPIANLTRVEVFGYPAMNWVRIRVVEETGGSGSRRRRSGDAGLVTGARDRDSGTVPALITSHQSRPHQ